MKDLQVVTITNYTTQSGKTATLELSYQLFGQPLHTAPIVLVNHALTGNSQITEKNGWWNTIVGNNKVIDTQNYTVLAFNIPGNGFANKDEDFTRYYKEFIAKDIARLFYLGLCKLEIFKLFAVIGGSVGGGIAWEMAALYPNLIQNLIPIATDWKATDWLIANCYVQERILENSKSPVADARLHAMTFYRTPQSLAQKFNRSKAGNNQFNTETWLNYHGEKLEERFQLSSYKMMNQVLKTIDITSGNQSFLDVVKPIEANILIITVNSDLFFKPEENWNTFVALKSVKDNVNIGEIKSIHGHDAFLIEYQQLTKLLKPIFSTNASKIKEQNDTNTLSHIRNW